jgi:hypothetical protein
MSLKICNNLHQGWRAPAPRIVPKIPVTTTRGGKFRRAETTMTSGFQHFLRLPKRSRSWGVFAERETPGLAPPLGTSSLTPPSILDRWAMPLAKFPIPRSHKRRAANAAATGFILEVESKPSFTSPLIWSFSVVLMGAALAVTLRSAVPARPRSALPGSLFRVREREGSRRVIHIVPGLQHQKKCVRPCFTRARFSGR